MNTYSIELSNLNYAFDIEAENLDDAKKQVEGLATNKTANATIYVDEGEYLRPVSYVNLFDGEDPSWCDL